MEKIISILSVENITHDVKSFVCEKPDDYIFIPGQATEVSVNKDGWKEEKRPFTFTSLNNAPHLEFIIKNYADHNGVTNQLHQLKPGDELIVRDIWGAIEYKGPGYFIAGGAGITPFIAVLRQLNKNKQIADNKLFFSNKTDRDINLEKELSTMLGNNVIFAISDEHSALHYNGMINESFLKEQAQDFSRHFYLCGPPKMVEALQDTLVKLGASPDSVVFEK